MPGINDVCNMALMRIGHEDTVDDITTDKTSAAIACNTFYAQCRDTVLRAHNWGFAKCQLALSLLDVTAPTNWAYAYAYPSDCLMLRSIVLPGQRYATPEDSIPYEIGNIGGVKVILCDQRAAEAVYTVRVDDLNLWDPLAISALAYMIASEVAMPLSAKPDLATAARQGYASAMLAAAGADSNEMCQSPQPDCEFIRARGTSDNDFTPGFPRY